MFVEPQRLQYQWIYDPQQQFLLFLPRWQDVDVSARNLLYKILKSLQLDTCLAMLNGEHDAFRPYSILADKQTFSGLIHALQPKWVSLYGDLEMPYAGLYQFPHPNVWRQDWQLKKRIWLSWHDLKYKVL